MKKVEKKSSLVLTAFPEAVIVFPEHEGNSSEQSEKKVR
jgi:hypothetical protein